MRSTQSLEGGINQWIITPCLNPPDLAQYR